MPRNVPHIPSPICGKNALLDIAMEAAERPIAHTRDETVLHRIEVYVVNVPFQIRVIANCVLPIAALPDAFLALEQLACRTPLRFQAARKAAFDQIPPRCKVDIEIRKRPNCMEMVRQDTNSDRGERAALLDSLVNSPQAINMIHEQSA